MANSKISALTSATTPLAGTETLPIVQGGATVKATVANITGSGLYPGSFTTLASTGNTILGDASTDTVRVNGYMGVGVAASANASIYAKPSALSGTTQNGVIAEIVGTSAATVIIRSFLAYPRTEAAAFTVSDLVGFYANNATKGAGSTVTNQHGVYVADQNQGTNNYGITSLVSSGTNKWNIYASGTAQNYFAGSVGIGTTSPQGKLAVSNAGVEGFEVSPGIAVGGVVRQIAFNRSTVAYMPMRYQASEHQFYNASSQVVNISTTGSVGVGTTANASAILDAQSTTKGVRMPNMTTAQKNAIASPAAGLMVFDTTLAKLCVYSGAAWQTITSV